MENIETVVEEKNFLYRVWDKKGLCPADSSSFHYGPTLEFTFLHNTQADIYIAGTHYFVDGDAAFFLSPGVAHAFSYYKNENAYLLSFDINPSKLKPAFDFDAFLALHNLSVLDIPTQLTQYDILETCIHAIPKTPNTVYNDHYSDIIQFLMVFFQTVQPYINTKASSESALAPLNDEFQIIHTWTHHNYPRKITLEEAASVLGYSKNHFCKKFKSMAGVSYISYLNELRIHKASGFLKNGYSIKDASAMTGFDDPSYFIQQFKKIFNMTPKRYMELYKGSSQ